MTNLLDRAKEYFGTDIDTVYKIMNGKARSGIFQYIITFIIVLLIIYAIGFIVRKSKNLDENEIIVPSIMVIMLGIMTLGLIIGLCVNFQGFIEAITSREYWIMNQLKMMLEQ